MTRIAKMTAGCKKVFLAALLGGLFGCSTAPIPVDLLISDVKIYPGTTVEPFVASIAIRDGKFLAIGTLDDNIYLPQKRIDGTGRFVIPGLWDAHTHIRSSEDGGLNIDEFARFGVTSIYDLGGYLERVKLVEHEIASGATQGPSIYPSYVMLNGESFANYQRVVTTEAEVKAAMDELVSVGAAQVKIHRALSPEMLPVVVRLAHEHGLRITGHIPLGVHPLDACQIGMDSIEHIGSFVEALISVAPEGERSSSLAIDHLLSEAADPIYDCLAERGIAVTPTLVIYPAIARRRAAGQSIPPEYLDFIESMKRITRRLQEKGVTLLTGTDTSDSNDPIDIKPGESLLDEIDLLEAAGVPPSDIIAMASLNAARSIGVADSTGSIESGKNADFLLLSSDPGEHVRNIRAMLLAFQMGQVVFGEL